MNITWTEILNALQAMWRQKWLIGGGTFAAVVLAVIALSFIQGTYATEASLVVIRPKYKEELLLSSEPLSVITYRDLMGRQAIQADLRDTMVRERAILEVLQNRGLELADVAARSATETWNDTKDQARVRIGFADCEDFSRLTLDGLRGLNEFDLDMLRGLDTREVQGMYEVRIAVQEETNIRKVYSPEVHTVAYGPSPEAAMYVADTLQRVFLHRVEEIAKQQMDLLLKTIEDTYSRGENMLTSEERILLASQTSSVLEIRRSELESLKLQLHGGKEFGVGLLPQLIKTTSDMDILEKEIDDLRVRTAEVEEDGHWIGGLDLSQEVAKPVGDGTGVRNEIEWARYHLWNAHERLVKYKESAQLDLQEALLEQKTEDLMSLGKSLEELKVKARTTEEGLAVLRRRLKEFEEKGRTIETRGSVPVGAVTSLLAGFVDAPLDATKILELGEMKTRYTVLHPAFTEAARRAVMLEVEHESAVSGVEQTTNQIAFLSDEIESLSDRIERGKSRQGLAEKAYEEALISYQSLEEEYWKMRRDIAAKSLELATLRAAEKALKDRVTLVVKDIEAKQKSVYRQELEIRQQERIVSTHRDRLEQILPVYNAAQASQLSLPLDIHVEAAPTPIGPKIAPKRRLVVGLVAFFAFVLLCAFSIARAGLSKQASVA